MFNLKDYIYYHTSFNIEIDKEKIHNEVEQLKESLLNLEKLIGPFKVKVVDGKVKLKTKDEF